MKLLRLEEMFPSELDRCLAERPLLVMSFGTIEWHSHHLPVGLDGLVANAICERIAERAEAVLAPVSYWAVGGVPYPYTLNLPPALIEPLIVALFEQFGAMGFRVITAFTGHFGLEQTLTLKRAALAVMQRSPVTILPLTEYDLVTDLYLGDHAATGETSLLWALYPELVRLESVPAEMPLDGIIGQDPRTTATAANGHSLLETIVQRSVELSTRILLQTNALQRIELIEAFRANIRVLEKTVQQRQILPKQAVPPVTTPAYVAFCQALFQGDYRAARAHAERKLASLAE